MSDGVTVIPGARPLTDKQMRCFELREKGLSYVQIAEILHDGISNKRTAAKTVQWHVEQARAKMGMPKSTRTRGELTEASLQIVEMYKQGLGWNDIAAAVGKTRGAVRHVIRRYTDPHKGSKRRVGKPDRLLVAKPLEEWDIRYEDVDVSADTSMYFSIQIPRD